MLNTKVQLRYKMLNMQLTTGTVVNAQHFLTQKILESLL